MLSCGSKARRVQKTPGLRWLSAPTGAGMSTGWGPSSEHWPHPRCSHLASPAPLPGVDFSVLSAFKMCLVIQVDVRLFRQPRPTLPCPKGASHSHLSPYGARASSSLCLFFLSWWRHRPVSTSGVRAVGAMQSAWEKDLEVPFW